MVVENQENDAYDERRKNIKQWGTIPRPFSTYSFR